MISRITLPHVDLPIHATAGHRPRPPRVAGVGRWCVIGTLILVAGFVIATSLITAPYTLLVPGDAQPVSSLITVPHGRGHPIQGKVLLTDVGVQNLHYLEYYWEQIFSDPANAIVPTGELTYNLPESEFEAQGRVDMAESQLTAESVALRQLGYPVPMRDVGVTIYVIDPTSPAWDRLQVGQVVTSIDGVPTTSPTALQNAVRAHQPGRHRDDPGGDHHDAHAGS